MSQHILSLIKNQQGIKQIIYHPNIIRGPNAINIKNSINNLIPLSVSLIINRFDFRNTLATKTNGSRKINKSVKISNLTPLNELKCIRKSIAYYFRLQESFLH
ncbi:hypothetical protein pb186bvf_004152 [Paramecium bursaria]